MKEVSKEHQRVIIVGGGLSGLAAAYYLKKHGVDVLIFEREQYVGGHVRSVLKEDKYIVDLGPSHFFESDIHANSLARELSLIPLLIKGSISPNQKYICENDKLFRLPSNKVGAMKDAPISVASKLRMLLEPAFSKDFDPESSLAEVASKRCGAKVLEKIISPIISSTLAADPRLIEAISILPGIESEKNGLLSLLNDKFKTSSEKGDNGAVSFRWGMGTITARLEEVLRNHIRTHSFVSDIERRSQKTSHDLISDEKQPAFKVRITNQQFPFPAEAVIVALPAFEAASILMQLDIELPNILSSIPYAPLAVVHTAFGQNEIKHPLDGFSVMFEDKKGEVRMLGSVWTSQIFSGRCPTSEILITSMLGGMTDPTIIDLPDSEIIGLTLKGLARAFKIDAKPSFVSIKRWSHAIPQYTIGHKNRLEKIKDRLAYHPGLFLIGNYFNGITINDSIVRARECVDGVLNFLKTRTPLRPA